MKRNNMCPFCFIKSWFVKSKPASINSTFEDYQNGVAQTPPMGWSSWNTFFQHINEDLILETAQAMKDTGLIDAGYQYINLDDCWQSSYRDDMGNLINDLQTFPSGIGELVKKVNALGLKLGAYTSNGTGTCEDVPASLHREKQDAYSLAKWGVEYFKYDFCHHEYLSKYAPLIYSISISKSDGKATEYSVNNALLSGLAKYMPDSKLPSGRYVSGLDRNLGAILFDNVSVDEAGEYVLTLNIKKWGFYEKFIIAKVNDEEEYEFEIPPQKPFNSTSRWQKKIVLKEGKNTIKLYNPITCKADSELYQYRRMGMALKWAAEKVAQENNQPIKPIVFSICEWGLGKPYNWGAKAGNLWRTTFDINPNWTWIKAIYNHTANLHKYASKGHYNDPDMLEVGNGKLTYNQNVSHFSLWCMLNAPLILGNDLRSMNEQIRAILTNKNLIAINQDSLCKQAKRVKKGAFDVLAKPLADGKVAIAFFNKSSRNKHVSYNLSKLVDDDYVTLKKQSTYNLVDQWNGDNLSTNGKITVSLEKHQTKVYVIG